MALKPPIFPKQHGDAILSADWNAGFGEVQRLDGAKVDVADGHTTGLLSTEGIAANDLTVRSAIHLPAGALDLAMLGMRPIPLEPLVLPGGMAARLVYERYPAGSAPPRLPAFVRITSVSPPAAVQLLGDWVVQLVGASTQNLIERYTYLSQVAQVAVTVQAVVFSATPVTEFQPFWGVDIGTAPTLLPTGGAIGYADPAGNLSAVTAAGASELAIAIMAGTSPSVTVLPNNGYYAIVQGTDGTLWLAANGQVAPQGIKLAPNTSPAISYRYNRLSYAWVDDQGLLVDTQNTGGPVMTGASPSVASFGNGHATAYQGTDKLLYVALNGAAGTKIDTATIAPGTNPSISSDRVGNYVVVWHGDQNHLFTLASGNVADTQHPMADGTSPSIAVLPAGGYDIAFQGDNGNLWVIGSSGEGGDMGVAMRPKTSPSVAAVAAGGFEVAFQGANGNLWTLGEEGEGAVDTGLQMAPGTNPSIGR